MKQAMIDELPPTLPRIPNSAYLHVKTVTVTHANRDACESDSIILLRVLPRTDKLPSADTDCCPL